MTHTTRRTAADLLAHGLRGDLADSAVGIELGGRLQSALTADIADGATPRQLLKALRDACDQDPVAYARMLELIVLAGLDELQAIASPPSSTLQRGGTGPPPTPPRRTTRRRR